MRYGIKDVFLKCNKKPRGLIVPSKTNPSFRKLQLSNNSVLEQEIRAKFDSVLEQKFGCRAKRVQLPNRPNEPNVTIAIEPFF